jgi:hypothetical protein
MLYPSHPMTTFPSASLSEPRLSDHIGGRILPNQSLHSFITCNVEFLR